MQYTVRKRRSSEEQLIFQSGDIPRDCMPKWYRSVIFLILILVLVFFCIGIGTGILIENLRIGQKGGTGASIGSQELQYSHHKDILLQMNAKNIEKSARYLADIPHHPGGVRNKRLAEDIAKEWENSGFDNTETFRYNIYLSYPESPGEISLINDNVVEKKLLIENEPPMDETEEKGKLLYPFNAYSPKGSVTSEVVYGNHGRTSDFDELKAAGIDVEGKIMLLRYGRSSRSHKVLSSQIRGAVGVILFSDPYDNTYPGEEYPKGWMMNKYAVQRGTINWLYGDALSIGYPSKENYFRLKESKYSGNPKIPCQPISASTAYDILKFMRNDSVPIPSGWQGGLNVTYVLSSGKGRRVTLSVNTTLETRESLTVCTKLYGKEEPDRFVMLGNHRDAWTYGASDASSGTATIMEIVRTLGSYKNVQGWRPRRSIMACSWGAEESGIMGSTEWADENHKFLTEHVVSYLNVDMAVEGNFTVRLKSLDFLTEGIFEAAKNVPAPDDPMKNLYEDWLYKSTLLENDTSLTRPTYKMITTGSDYRSLWHTYGTSCADFRYYFSRLDFPKLPQNGNYHTRYDSFGWMSKFVDPGFIHHLAIGRLWAGHALILVDATIIPFDLVAYAKQVKYQLESFEKSYEDVLTNNSISLSFAYKRLSALITKAEEFHIYVKKIEVKEASAYTLRSINDKLMNFERNFLLNDLTDNKAARHVVYANTYSKLKRTRFPGISAAIFDASKDPKSDWDVVRKQITFLVWCVDTANRSLDMKPIRG